MALTNLIENYDKGGTKKPKLGKLSKSKGRVMDLRPVLPTVEEGEEELDETIVKDLACCEEDEEFNRDDESEAS